MKIVICDDNRQDAEHIAAICDKYIKEAENDQIRIITDSGELDVEDADLLFLDIEMPEIDGIEIKERLEFKGTKPLIVFVTNYINYSIKTHGRNVIGFLTKPANEEFVVELLQKSALMLNGGKMVRFGSEQLVHTNNLQKIIIDHSYTRGIRDDGTETKSVLKTLEKWEAELQDVWFIRINRGCLLNCRFIRSMKGSKIILKDGTELTMSRTCRAQCEKTYYQYMENHAIYC